MGTLCHFIRASHAFFDLIFVKEQIQLLLNKMQKFHLQYALQPKLSVHLNSLCMGG